MRNYILLIIIFIGLVSCSYNKYMPRPLTIRTVDAGVICEPGEPYAEGLHRAHITQYFGVDDVNSANKREYDGLALVCRGKVAGFYFRDETGVERIYNDSYLFGFSHQYASNFIHEGIIDDKGHAKILIKKSWSDIVPEIFYFNVI